MKQKKTWQSYMSPTILARWHKESKNCPQEKFNKVYQKGPSTLILGLWLYIELLKSDNTRNEYYESLSKQVEAIEELFRNSIKWWFRIEISKFSKFHSWLQYCDFRTCDSATEWPQCTQTVIIIYCFLAISGQYCLFLPFRFKNISILSVNKTWESKEMTEVFMNYSRLERSSSLRFCMKSSR